MKNIKRFLPFLFLIFGVASAQDTISFIKDDYSKAVKLASAENKLLFVMVYADWCPHCNKMRKGTLSDAKVAEFYNSNFVNLMMNSELEFGKRFMRKYNVKTFPQFLFINKNQEVVYRLNGEYTVAEFLKEGQNAMNPKMQLTYLEMQYMEDMTNTKKALDYIEVLKKGKDRDQISSVARAYFETKPLETIFNADDWKIFAAGINDFHSREFQFLLANQEKFAKVSSPRRVENKILNVVMMMQKEAIDKQDSTKYNANREEIRKLKIARADSLAFRQDLTFYPKVNDWKRYKETTLAFTEKYLSNDAKMLNEIATNYAAEITDKKALEQAVKWALASNEQKETHETTFIVAKLYQKLGKNKDALKYATRSKEITENFGWDTKKVDGLISTLRGGENR